MVTFVNGFLSQGPTRLLTQSRLKRRSRSMDQNQAEKNMALNEDENASLKEQLEKQTGKAKQYKEKLKILINKMKEIVEKN